MTIRRPIHPHLSIPPRPCPSPLDPLSVKLRPHEDKQGQIPDNAPRLHKPHGIANSKIRAGGDKALAHVVQEYTQHEQVASSEQPGPVSVWDGEVEDGQAEGYEDTVGDDEGLDGAQGELLGKVGSVDAADVLAQVGGQRVGQVQRHG